MTHLTRQWFFDRSLLLLFGVKCEIHFYLYKNIFSFYMSELKLCQQLGKYSFLLAQERELTGHLSRCLHTLSDGLK